MSSAAGSSSSSSLNVVVHPLVLLSVVDHATRAGAADSKRRVVGMLLGQNDGNTINVSNSFAVPFEEGDAKTFFIDADYIEKMYSMTKKVSAREKLVGFYHSGPRIRQNDLEINEVIKRYTGKPPVMVVVHTRNRDMGIPTDAYMAVEEIKDDGTAAQKTFIHIPSSIGAEEAEEIGVEHLLRDIKDLDTGTLASRVADQLSSLRGLQSRLAEIKEYLELVVKGDLPVNHEITNNLQDVFNLLPTLEASPADGSLDGGKKTASVATIATNDQLLVMYLSSLIRAVIALHDLVNNKLEMAQTTDVPIRSASDKDSSAETKSAAKKDEKEATTQGKENDKRGL